MSYIEQIKAEHETISAKYKEIDKECDALYKKLSDLRNAVNVFEGVSKHLKVISESNTSNPEVLALKADVAKTLDSLTLQRGLIESQYNSLTRERNTYADKNYLLQDKLKVSEKIGVTSDIIEILSQATSSFGRSRDYLYHDGKSASSLYKWETPSNFETKFIDFELDPDYSSLRHQREDYRKRKATKVTYVGFKDKVLYLMVLNMNTNILKQWSIADGATEGKLQTAKYKKDTRVFILRKDEGAVPKDEIYGQFFNELDKIKA